MESVTLEQAVERAHEEQSDGRAGGAGNSARRGAAAAGALGDDAECHRELQQRRRTAPSADSTTSMTQPANAGDAIGAVRRAGARGVEMGGDHAGARSGRDRRTCRRPTCARKIAVATAQTYLAIIAQKRQVEVSLRARETSMAHLDYARRRLEAGAGTRLNELRAGQEVATNEARLENAQLGVRRAQEALGVLIAANGPADAAAEPVFDIPAGHRRRGWHGWRCGPTCGCSPRRNARPIACGATAPRTGFPTAIASFDPQALVPASIFSSARSWRFVVNFSQPIFDGGLRRGQRRFREAAFQRVAAGAAGAADSGAVGGAARAGDGAQHASARSRACARRPSRRPKC